MKRILPIIISLCLSCSALAQVPCLWCQSNEDYGFKDSLWGDCNPAPSDSLDSEQTRVYYDFTFNGRNKITGEWLLQVGTNATRFLSAQRYLADSIQRVTNRRSARVSNHIEGGDPFHYFDSYFISDSKCRFACRLAMDDIMYEETLPAIDWELQDSVANICGYQCRSARATFRGRSYFVFYAEDIPVSAGPWKLRGLPGLILHADVDDGKFVLHASQVGPSTGESILWQKYPYAKVSRGQYMKMMALLFQNFGVAIVSHYNRNPQVTAGLPAAGYVPPDLSWVELLEKE